MDKAVRIAMWSGPRNISTAMMRSFASRADAVVVDEPFYAAYLAATGLDHPMREEVIASQPTDWREVADGLVAPLPAGKRVFYQKHMTHHMIPEFGRDWIDGVTSAFLIRAPEAVLASYTAKRESVDLRDIGFVEQAEIFDAVAERLGHAPPVIDAADVLADPARTLSALCAAAGIEWDAAMLSWPKGIQPYDGVWAEHWYAAVARSTGFGAGSTPVPLPDDLVRLAERARPYYEKLSTHRLKPGK